MAVERFVGSSGADLVCGDPRSVLREITGDFDLVVIDAGPPATFVQGRLLTSECFAAVRRRLSPEGVLVLALPANPAHLSAPQRRAAGSVWRALGGVFPRRRLWAVPGVGLVLIGFASGRTPVPRTEVAARVRDRKVRLVSLAPERLADAELALEADRHIVPALEEAAPSANRDGRMVAVLDQMQADQLRLSGAGEALRLPGGGGTLVLLGGLAGGLALLILGRARYGAVAPVSTLAAALVGASLETTALLGYQVSRGSLYAEVGLVLAAFMAGGAAGAELLRRRAARCGQFPAGAAGRPLLGLALVALAAAGLAGLGAEGWAGGVLWVGIMLAAGGFVGAVYGAAAASRGSASPGALYALDLAGAAVGGLVAVLAVPWAGLVPSALAGALLATLAALPGCAAEE
jgi:spermidine synthase